MRRNVANVMMCIFVALVFGLMGCGDGSDGETDSNSPPASNPTAPDSLVGKSYRLTTNSGTMYYDFYFRANDYGNYKVYTSSGTYSFGDIYSYAKYIDNQGEFRAWDYNYNQPLVYYTDVVLTYDTSTSGSYTLTANSSLGQYSNSGSFEEF